MPLAGSVSSIGTSLLRLGAVVLLSAVLVAVMVLLLRWMTGQLHNDRAASRRRHEQGPQAAEPPPLTAPPTGPRRATVGHHPAGRRTAAAQAIRAAAVHPRRPVELVAVDLRRLTRELTMVPGGMPMARRRGLLAAYDDVLVEAAALLEVPHQLTALPASNREFERMRLLASLEAAGLVVTD